MASLQTKSVSRFCIATSLALPDLHPASHTTGFTGSPACSQHRVCVAGKSPGDKGKKSTTLEVNPKATHGVLRTTPIRLYVTLCQKTRITT